MFKEGKKIYFVPSLWVECIPCVIEKIRTYDKIRKDANIITARTKDGRIITDYQVKFSETKTKRYF